MSPSFDELERRLDALQGVKRERSNVVPFTPKAEAPAPAKPTGWRFTPYRDQDNLITEIIATPISSEEGQR